MIAGNNLPVMLRSGFRLVLFLVELAEEEMNGALVGEIGRQQMLELGAAGGCVALLQGEHGDRIDDVRIVRVVLDQTVEMTACFVVAFLCDEQAGQGQAGVTSARVGVDEIVQAVDGGLRGTLGLQLGSGEGGTLPVRAELQGFFGFVQGAQVVVGIGCRLGHGEMGLRHVAVGCGEAVYQRLDRFLVGVPGQHAVEVHQVVGKIGLVLRE